MTGEDRYGRVVASVYAGGRDAGLAQLRAGLACEQAPPPAVMEGLSAAAVDVDIDESGPHGEPGGVDDACARSAEIGANRHDPFALAQQVRPGEA